MTDVLVIGAGAAGLMCAIEAGRRGRRVIVIDHAEKPAEKIRISGGGRCNFTNLHATPKQFLSNNPHFCVSALKRFTQHDFIARVDARGDCLAREDAGPVVLRWLREDRSSRCCWMTCARRAASCGWALSRARSGGRRMGSRWRHRRSDCVRGAGDRDGRQVHSEDGGDGVCLQCGAAVRAEDCRAAPCPRAVHIP